jgi:hypothetical protein
MGKGKHIVSDHGFSTRPPAERSYGRRRTWSKRA